MHYAISVDSCGDQLVDLDAIVKNIKAPRQLVAVDYFISSSNRAIGVLTADVNTKLEAHAAIFQMLTTTFQPEVLVIALVVHGNPVSLVSAKMSLALNIPRYSL